MIVEADVRYRAKVRLHGERTERLRIVRERVPFAVPEYSGAEVVCRWNAPALRSVFAGDHETQTSEVLGAGGGFYRRAAGSPGSPEALRRMLERERVFDIPDGDEFDLAAGVHRPTDTVDLSNAVVSAIEPYDRRRWFGRLEKRIAGFALVDGVFCRRKSEPVLVAGTNGSGLPGRLHMERIGRSVGTPTVVLAWSEDVLDGSAGRGVFRLDRLEAAVAFAASYAGRREDEVKMSARFELLAPQLLRIDDEAFALAAAARQAIRQMSGDLTDLPRPIVDAAFDLRDMLPLPDLRHDLLKDAFERVVENLRPIVEDPDTGRDVHTLRQVLEEMDEALERVSAARPTETASPWIAVP